MKYLKLNSFFKNSLKKLAIMNIAKDIFKLNLDLALASSDDDDFFESNISSKYSENYFSYQSNLNNFFQEKMRKTKLNPDQESSLLSMETKKSSELETQQTSDNNQDLKNQIQSSKTDSYSQVMLKQQCFGSYADEISNLSKIQFQRVTKVKKYNTNLHGFNRIGARQLFIRTIVDVNPEFNIQYIYNTGIGTHSEKEKIISKIIQNTAKNMFGQEFELETSANNPGLLEFKQNSNIYSPNPTQEQLKKVIFRDFDHNQLIKI